MVEELHPDIRQIREREYGGEVAIHGGLVGPHGAGSENEENVLEGAAGDLSGEFSARAFEVGAFDYNLRRSTNSILTCRLQT